MPRDQVFISYSHRDRRWVDELIITLKPLTRKRKITVWDDAKIGVGKKWKDEIGAALAAAKLAVLLVTRNFLASEFVAENELPPLLMAAEKEGLKIVWIAVGYSLYEETDITEYQAANDPSRPLNSLTEAEVDRELVKIAKIIDSLAAPDEAKQEESGELESPFRAFAGPEAADEDDGPGGGPPPTNESAMERMRAALAEGKWAWRSIERLSARAGVSEEAALNILRNAPDVELGKGSSGRRIARLRTRLS